jgi:hypothetical protein
MPTTHSHAAVAAPRDHAAKSAHSVTLRAVKWPPTMMPPQWRRMIWRWPVITPPTVPPKEPPEFDDGADPPIARPDSMR